MFDLRVNTNDNNCFDRPAYVSHAVLLNQAINLFNQARWNGLVEICRSALLRRVRVLFDIEIIAQNQICSRRYGGITAVSIEHICGTLGRSNDFDICFNPLEDRIRDRWVSIAIARSQDTPLAPVKLIQIGKRYFVEDGHHRISVARARGEAAIDAEITIWEVSGPLPWETQPVTHAAPQTA